MAANPNKEVPQVEVQERDLGTLVELDLSTLDPGFTYRWVNKSQLKVARAKAKGFKIVDPAEDEGIHNLFGDDIEAQDGTYTVGDVVLMKMPKERHKARRHMVRRKTDQRLKGPVKKFRKVARDVSESRGQRIEVITNKDPERER